MPGLDPAAAGHSGGTGDGSAFWVPATYPGGLDPVLAYWFLPVRVSAVAGNLGIEATDENPVCLSDEEIIRKNL